MVSASHKEKDKEEVKVTNTEIDPDMDKYGLNSLFTNTDYKEITFTYK